MGEVYEAVNALTGVRVALKVVRPDLGLDRTATQALLSREVKLAQRVTHPNVCRVNDLFVHQGEEGQVLIVSMELLEGRNLAEALRQEGRFELESALDLAQQLIAGVDAAHAVGVVHRDLKPSNVMVCRSHNATRVVVTDFGLARLTVPGYSEAAATAALAGTLRYMAPEQLEGRADRSSDLYSLCLILYEVVTGDLPFSGSSDLAIALKRLSTKPRDPVLIVDDVPAEWRAALLRGLSREPESRFRDGKELLRALGPCSMAQRRWIGFGLAFKSSFRSFIIVSAAVFLILLGLFIAERIHAKPPQVGVFSQVLYVPLRQGTVHDAVLTGAGSALLKTLQQSPHLSITPVEDVVSTVKRMGRGSTGDLEPQVIRQLALRTGKTVVLYGSIIKNEAYTLILTMEEIGNDPRHAKKTFTRRFDAGTRQDVFRAIESAALWVRQVSGESAQDLSEQRQSPEDLTTGSWEALQLFEQARSRSHNGNAAAALVVSDEALAADPGFAEAQSLRGDVLAQLGRYREAFQAHGQALSLIRQRDLTGRERFEIESRLNDDNGDYDASLRTAQEWIAHYPNDYLPHFLLGNLYLRTRKYNLGLWQMQQAQRLDERAYVVYPHLAVHYLAAHQPDKAEACARKLRDLNQPEWASVVESRVLMNAGNLPAALAKLDTLADRQDDFWPVYALRSVAHLRADLGDMTGARNALTEAVYLADRRGLGGESAALAIAIAYLSWQQRDYADVKSIVLNSWHNLDDTAAIAQASGLLARIGDLRDAIRVAGALSAWPDVPRVRAAKAMTQVELALAGHDVHLTSTSSIFKTFPFPLDLRLYVARRLDDTRLESGLVTEIRSQMALLPDVEGESWYRTPGLYRTALRNRP